MAVNHVELNGKTVLDLRVDTVTPGTLVSGSKAHDASGKTITGKYVPKVLSISNSRMKLTTAPVQRTLSVTSKKLFIAPAEVTGTKIIT